MSGIARLEGPSRNPIAADPAVEPAGSCPIANTALLETLGIATQALARACAQAAALLPGAHGADAVQPPSADGALGRTGRPHRRMPASVDGARGVCVPTAGPAMDAGTVVTIYCAGCTGLQTLAHDRTGVEAGDRAPTRIPVYKLGSSSGSPRTRLLELSAIGYAARFEADGEDEQGFDDWTLARIVARPSTDRAILVHGGVIAVRLPTTLSPAAFEARLREALEPFRIEYHVGRGGGGDHLFPRWTRPRHPGGVSSRATELYCVRPREDGDCVVSLVERILEEARAARPVTTSRQTGEATPPGLVEHEDLLALLEQLLAGRTRTSGVPCR